MLIKKKVCLIFLLMMGFFSYCQESVDIVKSNTSKNSIEKMEVDKNEFESSKILSGYEDSSLAKFYRLYCVTDELWIGGWSSDLDELTIIKRNYSKRNRNHEFQVRWK